MLKTIVWGVAQSQREGDTTEARNEGRLPGGGGMGVNSQKMWSYKVARGAHSKAQMPEQNQGTSKDGEGF